MANQKIIVSIEESGITKYVFGSRQLVGNIREPTFTTDLEKAKKWGNEVDAHNYYTHFACGKYKYKTEEYRQPVNALN